MFILDIKPKVIYSLKTLGHFHVLEIQKGMIYNWLTIIEYWNSILYVEIIMIDYN